MIARIWKGAVRNQDGDVYADYMRQTGVAGYASTPGNLGVWMLRRDDSANSEFLMFTLWDSLEAVKEFAGEEYETAVFYPEDDRYLVERDLRSAHYVVEAHVPSKGNEAKTAGQVVEDHVAAFNAHDLDGLLASLSADATWITGSDRFCGTAELTGLFATAFANLNPRLTIREMVVDGDRVACELSEELVVDGKSRVDHIAGFYRIQCGRIATAKIYREGSADP
ncbi:MAG: nuclear transport factor 2 family protein [Gaiellaceae bacterium]